MRTIGLLLLVIGALALAAPFEREYLPHFDLDDATLRIAGASVLALGLIAVWFTRSDE